MSDPNSSADEELKARAKEWADGAKTAKFLGFDAKVIVWQHNKIAQLERDLFEARQSALAEGVRSGQLEREKAELLRERDSARSNNQSLNRQIEHMQAHIASLEPSGIQMLIDGLKLIAKGPPGGLANDEVASWAAWLAREALAAHGRHSETKPAEPTTFNEGGRTFCRACQIPAPNHRAGCPHETIDRLQSLANVGRRAKTLFDAIAHGDEQHRAWLKKAIEDHFAGRPVERP